VLKVQGGESSEQEKMPRKKEPSEAAIAGAIGGAIIGGLVGGPPGVIVGGIVGLILGAASEGR
jgi:hypothetical protein